LSEYDFYLGPSHLRGESMRGVGRGVNFIILLGLAARLIPSAFYAHPWDMYIWIKSGELGLHELNIYKFDNPVEYPWGFYAYPPAWLYWLVAATILGNVVGNLNFKIFLIKLPIILADAAVAILLYRLALRLGYDERRGAMISAIWLFNPITYFISAFWGMFDSIAVLFQLLAIYYILEERYVRAGVAAGIGAAVKILPALMVLPTLIHIFKRRGISGVWEAVLKVAAPMAAAFLLISTPFLSTPLEYLRALFQHTKSVGSFTYWIALAALVNLSSFWFIPIIAIGIASIAMARRMAADRLGLIWGCAIAISTFLASSPKVNIQYVDFLIPLILLSKELWTTRNLRRNFILLMLAGSIWIACSWIILAGYDLDYLGRLYVSESYDVSPAQVAMVIMSIFGGTRFVALLLDYLNLQKYDMAYISKWNLAVYTSVALIGIASILPSPSGVVLPDYPIRIAIPESADSAFIPGSVQSIDQFLRHYNVTHVVLAFSPDFVNTYDGYHPHQDITVYFRFRTQPDRWSQGDVKWLIEGLRSRGVKVLLGVYLRAEGPVYRYSIQGFSVDWVEGHPEVIGAHKLLLFNASIDLSGERIPYSSFFSNRVERIARDFGFDGVYLMAWDDWRVERHTPAHLLPLLRELKSTGITVFVEGPVLPDRRVIEELLKEADYVVLGTAPLINRIYHAMRDNPSIIGYEGDLMRALGGIPDKDRGRILFGVYTFSFVDGWFNPAIELQVEVNRYSGMGFSGGYAIYYADRYAPYKLTVKSL